jgi:D-3-phosphoglycerate dehydrogenase / 2-oxoglutarate reductase
VNKKIVLKITDYIEKDLQWEEEECDKLGIDFKYYQLISAPAGEIIEALKDADIVITNGTLMNRQVLNGLPNLKLLMRHGIGYDNVDVDAATKNGIVFANQATAYCQEVAEHTIMLMFDLIRMKKRQDKLLQEWVTSQNRTVTDTLQIRRLKDKTLGIIGCGNIGSLVLKMVQGFGLQILVCDPYLSEARYNELGIEHVTLDFVLTKSDIVTLHVPLTDETGGMLNFGRFEQMKKTAIIINTSRGPVVNSTDLFKALKNGLIAGAGLDVFENEPPHTYTEKQLLQLDNVIASPHLAWYSDEGGWNIRYFLMDDVRAFVNGQPPKSVINPEVFESMRVRFPFKRKNKKSTYSN